MICAGPAVDGGRNGGRECAAQTAVRPWPWALVLGFRFASARVAQIVKSSQGKQPHTHGTHTTHGEEQRRSWPTARRSVQSRCRRFLLFLQPEGCGVVCVWRLDGCGEEGVRSVEERGGDCRWLEPGRQHSRRCGAAARWPLRSSVGGPQPAALRPGRPTRLGKSSDPFKPKSQAQGSLALCNTSATQASNKMNAIQNQSSILQHPASPASACAGRQASQGPALEPSPSRHNAPFPYPVGLAWLPDRNPAAARMQRRERRCSDGALKDASSSPLSLANSQRVPVPRIPGFRA